MQQARKHAVIAGTGRAGTSFLVRFLDACGLETGAHSGEWFDRAKAGLEHELDASESLPYVIKDPWLFGYCERVDLKVMGIDALLLPMRELMDAAESRVHQERLARVDLDVRSVRSGGQVVGSTPGGVLYSLDVVDQARILATGFHNLVLWAVRNQLPLYPLEFPRMVEDGDYLVHSLQPWLGSHCDADAAKAAFVRTADSSAVRVRSAASAPDPALELGRGEPDARRLDRTAMSERLRELSSEIEDLRHSLSAAEQRAHAAEQAAAAMESARNEASAVAAERESALSIARADAEQAGAALARTTRELSAIRSTAIWQARQRLMRHPWIYQPARLTLRTLMRASSRR